MAVAAQGCQAVPYCRRRPEHTILYQIIQQHLETYLRLAREDDWDGERVPAYVEREFRHYLECGILAYGFARARCPDCGHDFLVAFSCKGRTICPSCNARRMAETAAHRVDHVIPPLPVRQWVFSVQKRLRWYLEREPRAVSAVLHIFLRVIEAHLRASIPTASPRARLGAVSFVHRFGSALNRHIHLHCCIIDGLFDPGEDGQVRFLQAPALPTDQMATITEPVRRRVLRWFARSGLLEPAEARDMLGWAHGGFSLDAAVRIAGPDRAGLERLLRYCARPPFALERLEQINPHQLIYHLPKPRRDGRTTLVLSPLELIDALAALISPPRRHRHRYHGVLAPNSPLRAAVTAYGREEAASPQAPAKSVSATDEEPASGSPARYLWAMLLARLFEALPLVCPCCGANTCLPAGRCASSPLSPRPHPSRKSSPTSASQPGHPRSRLSADRPPGTRRPSRRRTGTLSLSPSPSSNSISVSPGSRRLLREAVLRSLVLPPSGMTPSPLQPAASAGNGRRARSLRHVSGP